MNVFFVGIDGINNLFEINSVFQLCWPWAWICLVCSNWFLIRSFWFDFLLNIVATPLSIWNDFLEWVYNCAIVAENILRRGNVFCFFFSKKSYSHKYWDHFVYNFGGMISQWNLLFKDYIFPAKTSFRPFLQWIKGGTHERNWRGDFWFCHAPWRGWQMCTIIVTNKISKFEPQMFTLQ